MTNCQNAGKSRNVTLASRIVHKVPKKDAEERALRRDFILALVLTLPVFLLEMGTHLIPGMHALIDRSIGMQNSWYLQFVLTTLVMFIPGIRFYEKGLPALFKGAPDMNSLVAVGSLAAYGYSLVATFLPGLLSGGSDKEQGKRIEVAAFCWQVLGQADFTRSDAIVAVGGGATTDLGGFVAATWLRGRLAATRIA